MSNPGGRSQIPADVQSPVHVVKQIRDAHKQMLALSRNNFAKTPNDTELFPQAPAASQTGWQHEHDAQPELRSLDSISELSDSRYQRKQQTSDASQPAEQPQDKAHELRQQNDRLSRELVSLNYDMDRQQHEQFKLRQEQQLQFDDLRQHASNLESQLHESQSSTGELLSVNNFLDTELRKHKTWLDSSQQTSGHYRHLFKQEEHAKEQLTQQLHDTQAQLAENWRESSHMRELVAELQGQTAAAADHQAHVRDLTDANRKLDIANGQLHDTNGELLEYRRQLEEANRDLTFQLDGLRSALTDAFQEHEAAQQSSVRQHAQQAADHSQTVDQLTGTVRRIEAHASAAQQQLDQAQDKLYQVQATAAEQGSESSNRMAELSKANVQLAEHVSALDRQLEQSQQQLHQVQDSNTAQHAQQASEAAARLAELSQVNAQLQEHISHLDVQLQQTQRQLHQAQDAITAQHAQQGSEAASQLAELSTAKDQLEEHAANLNTQLSQAQHQLIQTRESHQAQHAQQAAQHADALAQLSDSNRQLEERVSSLDGHLRQKQHEAQQAAEDSSRLADLHAHNDRLEGQSSFLSHTRICWLPAAYLPAV